MDARTVLATEQGFVDEHFGGSLAEYLQALRRARLSRVEVRAFLADELRRDTVATRFVVAKPSAAAVSAFYQTYASFTARLVEVPEPVGWLGERRRGYALETFAPYPVFTLGRAGKVQTAAGRVLVKPLGASLPLGALPLTDARPTIEAALRSPAAASSARRRTTTGSPGRSHGRSRSQPACTTTCPRLRRSTR